MECPACGAENKPDAVFCLSCGGPLPDVPFAQLEKKERERPPAGEEPAMPGFLRESESTRASETPADRPAPPEVAASRVPEAPNGAPQGPAAAMEDRLVTSPGGFVFDAAPPPPAPNVDQAPPAAPPQAPAAVPSDATTPLPAAAVTPQAPPPPPVDQVPPAPPVTGPSVVEETGTVTPTPQTPAAAPADLTTPLAAAAATPPAPPPPPIDQAPPAAPPQAPAAVPSDATTPLPAAAVTPPAMGSSVVEEIGAETPVPPPPAPQAQVPPAPQDIQQGQPQPAYYIPPEADHGPAAPRVEAVPAEGPPTVVLAAPAAAQSQESTQAMAPVIPAAAAAAAARERKSVCPECYAPNPEGNMYCQECGSALPLTTARPPAPSRPAVAAQPGPQQTAVLPPAAPAGTATQAAYAAGARPQVSASRGENAFGAADIVALLAIGAGAIAVALSYVLDTFAWKKGLDIMIFSHQGAYTPGRTDLLGGPGILPYEGAEFFTVGLVACAGLALALIFLAVRVGRGPMFILSGSLMLLPAAYMLFQAVLPLRQAGIDVDPALGLSGMFFGNSANVGAGLSVWFITGAGALLVVAGFLAPPRGWGRLLTFLLCFSAVLGVAFFCAACYNWNLFISQPAAAPRLAGRLAAGPLASCLFMLS